MVVSISSVVLVVGGVVLAVASVGVVLAVVLVVGVSSSIVLVVGSVCVVCGVAVVGSVIFGGAVLTVRVRVGGDFSVGLGGSSKHCANSEFVHLSVLKGVWSNLIIILEHAK